MAEPCERWLVPLSALVDGEDPGVPLAALRDHLRLCNACAAWVDAAGQLSGAVRAASGAVAPDLTADVLLALGRRPKVHLRRVRVLVALGGALQLVAALWSLLGGGHAVRDLASIELALAVSLVYAVWRPHAAAGLLPLAGMLALVGAATGIADLLAGVDHLRLALSHLLPSLVFVLLLVLARSAERKSVSVRAGVAW
jgi:predicted anti-sigma-YlaC factor YlaD